MIRHYLLALLILGCLGAETAVDISSPPKADIVDNNHYFSESNKEKTYKITELKKNIPISVVIKPPSSASETNPLTLTLSSGSNKKSCTFKNLHSLCVLEKVEQESGTLTVSCSSVPCQVSWSIYQMPINKFGQSKQVEDLYEIPSGYKRLHIALTCASLQVPQPMKLAIAFSNLDIEPVILEKSLIISFPNPGPGYILIKKNPEFKSCLQIGMKSIGETISTQIQSDLLKKGQKAVYPLLAFPTGIFRFDMEFHWIPADGIASSNSTIAITALLDGTRTTIRTNQIQFPTALRDFDMSYAVPAIDKSRYSNLQLEITTKDPHILVDFQLATDDHILVQATERSVFDLKKGEKLPFRLVKEEHAEKGDLVHIFLSDEKALNSTKSQCELGPECEFEIEAISDVKGNIYLGTSQKQAKEILILDFKDDMKLTKKVRQFESTYIKKQVELKKALQVTVNTGNVIVYMATSKLECGLPSPTCYNAIGNIHKSYIFTPETEDDKEVIFLIQALDNCQFTLTLLEQNTEFVELEDSQPFAYQFDNKEQEIQFKFHRTKQTDVTFNLIAPLHSLDLIVENSDKLPKDIEKAQISAEGFLTFTKKDAKKGDFSILVRKRDAYKDRNVHFTIIASTTGKEIRLETGITHYQTLPKEGNSNAEYIFEFDKGNDFVINFYSHNVKGQKVDIKMVMSTVYRKQKKELTDQQKKKMVKSFTIDKASDKLDLNTISEDLCTASGQVDSNCEIFMILQNKMDIEVDVAITLMSRHSVVQLKDGIWQSFDLNSVAKTAHFFFYPHNKNDDISLLYKTDDQQLRLKYRLFYGDDDHIDPAEWPFPSQKMSTQDSDKMKKFKPINHLSISKKEFAHCWPYCIVLVSMVELEQKEKTGSFSLMASNSIMEIPEKQKIQIMMAAEEEKAYLVDLKYAIDKEKDIYFNVFHSMGLVNIYANVYSERNDRVPDEDEADFKISGHNEMKIPIDKIKSILEEQEMDQHINLYLYILVQAVSDSKFSIEFEFSEQDEEKVKMISFDSFEHVKLNPSGSKLFYTSIDQPFEIKILRSNGFPFYYTQTCKKSLDECIDQFKDSEEKGTQLLTKVAAVSEAPCKDCFQMFRISAKEDPAEATIHLQSSSSQIELAESKSVYDFTEHDEANRYILYAIKDQQTFINIDISEGDIEVEVTDLHKVSITKEGSKIISISIPAAPFENGPKLPAIKKTKEGAPNALTEEEKQKFKEYIEFRKTLKEPVMDGYAYSDKFTAFHVTVKSKSSNPSIYTITYSSGERQFDLQDGLVVQYLLEPEKQHVFYYSSRSAGHAYLTISMEKSLYLKDLDITLKYCEPKDGLIDEDCWTEYSASRPPLKDKTPNPTIMYSLPAKNYFAVFLENKGSHEQTVSMGINHQEIMILPFDKQYPFAMHQAENINFLFELSNPGYIQMVVRKCDESSPSFAYTYDYDGFQDGEYTYETELTENPKTNFYSKVKPGTLYLHFESPITQSLLSISVHYSQKKIKDSEMKPGNNGDMTYSIVDSTNAEITMHPPICGKQECPKKIKYTLMTTSKMRDLYTQLVCPSNFFSSYENVSIDPIKEEEVTPKSNSDGTISFSFKLADQISYVGVKVSENKSGKEVYYRPIEVATLWGQLSRTSHSHKLAISTVFICSLLGVIIMVRRNARRGYKAIEEEA